MMTRLRLVSLWALCAAGCSSAAASTNDAGVGGNLPPGTGGIGVSAYQSGSRIKMKIYSTADGARRFNNWYDSQKQMDCGVNIFASDGKRRCLPLSPAHIGDRFSDSACSIPLAIWTPCLAAPLAVEQSGSSSGCAPGTAKYFSVGAAYTGTVYYKGGPTPCGVMPSNAVEKYFAVGAEIPPTEFAEITETIE